MEVKWVLRKEVRPDPEQPRKTFDKEKLQELADSINAVGIRQPIQVEWVVGLRIVEPDLVSKVWTVVKDEKAGTKEWKLKDFETEKEARAFMEKTPGGYYKIVDGERRWRAAELAKVERIPVMIVDTSSPEWEKQKLAIQMVLNQQHENITALEEAAAYAKEIESGRHTAESLYKALGISRGTLFSRLALNRVDKRVRDALLAGNINTSVAGLLAMVPADKIEDVLNDVAASEYDTAMPFRDVQSLIEREYAAQLKDAVFDMKDAELVPAEWTIRQGGKEAGQFAEFKAKGAKPILELQAETARWMGMPETGRFAVVTGVLNPKVLIDGVEKKAAQELAELINGKLAPTMTLKRIKGGACTDCPYRSGNIDGCGLKNPNVCTLPSCFAAKTKAARAAIVESAVEKGKTVLPPSKTGNLFNSHNASDLSWNAPYVKPSEKCAADKKGRTYKELVGEAVATVHALNENGTLVPLMDKEAVAKALKEKGIKVAQQSTTSDYQENERKRKEKAKQLEAAAEPARAELVEQVKAGKSDAKFLRLIGIEVCNTYEYLQQKKWGGVQGLKNALEKLGEPELRMAIAEAIASDAVDDWAGKFNATFRTWCEDYGVDLEKHVAAQKEEAHAKDAKDAKVLPAPGKEKAGGGSVKEKKSKI